ncbi:STAS domain-containing protein [Streptomyces sp. NPDC001185]|uniref:STAS domain-containing protein n=1 Tax=Streptomyces sp. NPDC001185 TaxID=3154380 RepID=UPI0033279F20
MLLSGPFGLTTPEGGVPHALVRHGRPHCRGLHPPRGEIDFDTLTVLLARTEELPASVTGVNWDLRHGQFVDVAGLHLLADQRQACQDAGRILSVVGVERQPRRLLQLARELFPAGRWGDFLPGGLFAAAG